MNNLVRDAAYIHYAANKARVQNAMKRLDESTNVLTEEQINQIILEEFNSTEMMGKIKTIFTNMVTKFVEYTKKQIQNKHDEAYLKAIQPKVAEVAKSKNIPLEMQPYENGINNIKNMNNIFSKFKPEMYDTVKADNKDECIANIQKFMMDGFNPQGQIKFDQFCLNYFQGGNGNSQKINTNVNQLNMDGIVTWCLDFPKQLGQINNDINNILGLIGKAVQGINPTPQPNTNPPTTKQQNVNASTDYSKADIRHKAYQYKSILESVFNEADNQPPAQTAPAQAANAAQGQNPPAETKPITGLGQNDKAVDTSGVKIDKQAASQEQQKTQSMGMYMGAIQNVATAILNARLRSSNIIYNDYIKILQTVCPRNEYMQQQQQPATQNPQPQQPAPGQNPQNP